MRRLASSHRNLHSLSHFENRSRNDLRAEDFLFSSFYSLIFWEYYTRNRLSVASWTLFFWLFRSSDDDRCFAYLSIAYALECRLHSWRFDIYACYCICPIRTNLRLLAISSCKGFKDLKYTSARMRKCDAITSCHVKPNDGAYDTWKDVFPLVWCSPSL